MMTVNRQWVRATLAPVLVIALGEMGARIARELVQFVRDVGYGVGKDESLLEAFVRIVYLEERDDGTRQAARVAFDAADLIWLDQIALVIQSAWSEMLEPDAISQQLAYEAGSATAPDERLVCVVGDAQDPLLYPAFEYVAQAFRALDSGQRPCRLAFVVHDAPPGSPLQGLPCIRAPWDLLDGMFLYASHSEQSAILSRPFLSYMIAEALWSLIITGFAFQAAFQNTLRELCPAAGGIERVGILVPRQLTFPRAAILEIAAAEVARDLMTQVLAEELTPQFLDHNAFAQDAIDPSTLLTPQQLLDNMKIDMLVDVIPADAAHHIGPRLDVWGTLMHMLANKDLAEVPQPTEASHRLLSNPALSNVSAAAKDGARDIITHFEATQHALPDDADAQQRMQSYHETLQGAEYQAWTHQVTELWDDYYQSILDTLRRTVRATVQNKGRAEVLRMIEGLQEHLVGAVNIVRRRTRKAAIPLQEQVNAETSQVSCKRRIALNEEEQYIERQPSDPDQALLEFGTDIGKKLAPRDKHKAVTSIIVTLVVTLSLAGTFISSDESSSILHTLFPFLPVLPVVLIGRVAFSGLMRVSKIHQLNARRRLFQKYKPVALLCEQFEQQEAIARNIFFGHLGRDLAALEKRYRQDWHQHLAEAQAHLDARIQQRSIRYERRVRRKTEEQGLIARYDEILAAQPITTFARDLKSRVMHRGGMKQAFWRHLQNAVGAADWIEELSNGHIAQAAFAFALGECDDVFDKEGWLPETDYAGGERYKEIAPIHPLMHAGRRDRVPLRPHALGVAVPRDRQFPLRHLLERDGRFTLIDSFYPHTIIVFATYIENLAQP
jgi:hypothetical protein